WPLFEEAAGVEAEDDAIVEAFREPVRAEIRAGIGDEHYEALARSARWRRQLRETVDAIHGRRSCGSTFRIIEIPWNGYNARDLDQFAELARADKIAGCQRVTFQEADRLAEASRALQRDPAVKA